MSAALESLLGAFPRLITVLRRRLRAMGYATVPAHGKTAHLPQWREAAAWAGEAKSRRWEAVFTYEDATDGRMKTSHCDRDTNMRVLSDGLACPDMDVPDTEVVERVEAATRTIFGPTPPGRVGQAPKSLRVYRAAAPVRKLRAPALLLPDPARGRTTVETGPGGFPPVLLPDRATGLPRPRGRRVMASPRTRRRAGGRCSAAPA